MYSIFIYNLFFNCYIKKKKNYFNNLIIIDHISKFSKCLSNSSGVGKFY